MKTLLRSLLLLSILFLFSRNTIAQTPCGWQQGDFKTYSQNNWDDPSSEGGLLLIANFFNLYGGSSLNIGDASTISFTSSTSVFDFLPTAGTPGALNGSATNPLSSDAGSFAGQVLALQLNKDFSDAGYIQGTQQLIFGDLIIHDFTSVPAVNGMSVRQFLAIANTILGGGAAAFGPTTASAVASLLNYAFENGTPSQFAQDHLKRGWQQGDMLTYSQNAWGSSSSDAGTLLHSNFLGQYGSSVAIGGTHTITLTSASAAENYLPSVGPAGPLTGSSQNPLTTSSGELGGEVFALKFNVDFSDANLLTSINPLGDLIIHDFSDLPVLNGQSIRQFLTDANLILGGDGVGLSYGASTAAAVAVLINNAFLNSTPSQFAQEHLKRGWSNGDMLTYSQEDWGTSSTDAGILLLANFNSHYLNDLIVGGNYTLTLTNADAVFTLLPALSSASALNGNYVDPQTSVAGELAGEVVALKLNVDFSDFNLLSSKVPFGDLVFKNFSTQPILNGQSIRDFLATSEYILGGGQGAPFGAGIAAAIARILNGAFRNGVPSEFAQDHLSPCNTVPVNQCPTADALNIATPVGTAINVQLQGADADGNTLTYSISQNPTHGTATTTAEGAATYTPTAGYSGTDQFKYKVNDGACETEATVDVTVVVCPAQQGYWKNNTAAWPASATPMLLGTVSYTKPQLITILNTPIGIGNKADASLILAHKLIAVKLSIANGSPVPQAVLDAVAAADALIGSNTIPMKIKPNTPLGQQMIALANILETYSSGTTTTGCGALRLASSDLLPATEISLEHFPNPFSGTTTISYSLPEANHVHLTVYNFIGGHIATLTDGMQEAGYHSVEFKGSELPCGIYFCRMQSGDFSATTKLLLVK